MNMNFSNSNSNFNTIKSPTRTRPASPRISSKNLDISIDTYKKSKSKN